MLAKFHADLAWCGPNGRISPAQFRVIDDAIKARARRNFDAEPALSLREEEGWQ